MGVRTSTARRWMGKNRSTLFRTIHQGSPHWFEQSLYHLSQAELSRVPVFSVPHRHPLLFRQSPLAAAFGGRPQGLGHPLSGWCGSRVAADHRSSPHPPACGSFFPAKDRLRSHFKYHNSPLSVTHQLNRSWLSRTGPVPASHPAQTAPKPAPYRRVSNAPLSS